MAMLETEIINYNEDDFLKAMLENPYQGVLIIDNEGRIVYINSLFENITNITESDKGKKIWEKIANCKLYNTVLEGYSRWGEILKINGKQVPVVRFPIKDEKKIIGAAVITLFPDMIIARECANKLNNPNIRNSSYKAHHTCKDIIGQSQSIIKTKLMARKVARTSSTVFISGESGTGKGILAEAIHNKSVRREGPFVKVNCAAIPDSLIEAELFGYVEGAFTGARRGGKPGKFELADGGTILLDEIGDMPLHMQAKLLHILQNKEVERIGGTNKIPLDFRVITATNKDLTKLIKEGKFREDLYYRVKVLEIPIEPLRKRKEDIPLLVKELISKINKRIGTNSKGVTQESLENLMEYDWPGNIRELENVLEQAMNWCEDEIIKVSIPTKGNALKGKMTKCKNKNYYDQIYNKERNLIIDALIRADGNKSQAARLLNIQRSVLYKKIKKLNIDVSQIG